MVVQLIAIPSFAIDAIKEIEIGADGVAAFHKFDHNALPSVARLFLVANGKDSDRLTVDAVQDDVAAVSEVNQPFPIFWVHLLYRATEVRLMDQNLDARADGVYGALRCVGILRYKKSVEPSNVSQCRRRPNQT